MLDPNRKKKLRLQLLRSSTWKKLGRLCTGKASRLIGFGNTTSRDTDKNGKEQSMMQLASLLHSRGFSITIVHAHFNAPDPRNHPHFRFESFADGIDPVLVAGMGIMDQVYTIIAHCEQPLVSLMKRIQSGDEFVDCIVSDSLYSGGRVAGELGLPWVVLRTNSPTSFMLFGSFVLLHQLGHLPVKVSASRFYDMKQLLISM
ncbi:UDP-glycosyltransferase 76F1-like isoform X2 [Nymphaea colorata]|uniref:UDP-glycosyltransferase 76F1-like isoform X2 n=1 Tax=Nymphaea colorata TaxID=210225 RepID=UPI00214EA272|nr:UDP-glycosyltransferase 76F1-like isoform X2 [Nymphaea colorata]